MNPLRLFVVLCVASWCAVAAPPAEKGKPMRKQDAVAPLFADGPELREPSFAQWLAKQTSVKVPFTIWRTPRRVGAIGALSAKPERVLRFDDSALGIALDERLVMLCGDADPCRVWLSGRMGALLPLPGAGADETFSVHAVHERVEGEGPFRAQFARTPECLAIRTQKPLHCARGPARCEKCRAAAAQPAKPKLLDLCPWGDVARPTIELVRDGETRVLVYDVLKVFADEAEAKAFAQRYGIPDAQFGEQPGD